MEILRGNQTGNELFDRYVKVVESSQPHDIEIEYDADGIRGWFRNMAVKLGDGIAVSFSDITARKRAEAQSSYQAFLLENVSDAIFAMDRSLCVTLWSRGAQELYGWKAAEVLGRPAPDMVKTDNTSDAIKANLTAVDAGVRRSFETIHHNRNGDAIYVNSVATALHDSYGESVGYVVVNRDLSERRRHEIDLMLLNLTLERRVKERTEELERSNRELDQFAYVASHDLRAPLRGIATLAEWIRADAGAALPAASAVHLSKLISRVKRMDSLLEDLLAYARADRQRHTPQMVDTKALVNKIAEFLALPPGFQVKVSDSMPTLLTERVPLETVFRNLIHNAYKHHDHPDQGCVAVSAEDLGDTILFSVTDDGPGISPEFHERIFQIFQTLKPRDEVEGSGMGLTVVKKIIESRGGSIAVESELGAGATFYFIWPKRVAG